MKSLPRQILLKVLYFTGCIHVVFTPEDRYTYINVAYM